MAGEEFVVSGAQIATYSSYTDTYPSGSVNIEFDGLATYDNIASRYVLIRNTGTGSNLEQGDFFTLWPAIETPIGSENWGADTSGSSIMSTTFVSSTGFQASASGDTFLIFGLSDGDPATNFIVSSTGFYNGEASASFEILDGQPIGVTAGGSDDGELSVTELFAAHPDSNAQPLCFTRGTSLATPSGPKPVEDLKIGDVVTTQTGREKIVWIGKTRLCFTASNSKHRPIVIKAGALSNGCPERNLSLSPAHRVLIKGAWPELFAGTPVTLVPARNLINGQSIYQDHTCDEVEYWHVMFANHEIVFSEGVASESFLLGSYIYEQGNGQNLSELALLFPDLFCNRRFLTMPTVERVAKGFEARVIAKAIYAESQAVLDSKNA